MDPEYSAASRNNPALGLITPTKSNVIELLSGNSLAAAIPVDVISGKGFSRRVNEFSRPN